MKNISEYIAKEAIYLKSVYCRETTVWENIFANDTLDNSLISKIYKELIRQTIQLENEQRT